MVTGALERMQNDADPCVLYDAQSKLWIYLHFARTPEMHGMCARLVHLTR